MNMEIVYPGILEFRANIFFGKKYRNQKIDNSINLGLFSISFRY